MEGLLSMEEINAILAGMAEEQGKTETVSEDVPDYPNMKKINCKNGKENIEMLKDVLLDALEKQKECNDDYSTVIDTVNRVILLSDIARKEGLLSLEDKAKDLAKERNSKAEWNESNPKYQYNLKGIDRLLVSTIMLVLDGTDPDMVEKIAANRYFSYRFEGREALSAYIVIQGCLLIQSGCNPRLVEETLISVLPEDAEDVYLADKYNVTGQAGVISKEIEIPEEFFNYIPDELHTTLAAETLGKIIVILKDMDIQRFLKETNNCDLAVALKGLPGDARKKIFSNMTARQKELVYMDIEFMGEVRKRDIGEASVILLRNIENLSMFMEINLLASGNDELDIEKAISDFEHEALRQNREIDSEIKELETRILKLKRSKLKV